MRPTPSRQLYKTIAPCKPRPLLVRASSALRAARMAPSLAIHGPGSMPPEERRSRRCGRLAHAFDVEFSERPALRVHLAILAGRCSPPGYGAQVVFAQNSRNSWIYTLLECKSFWPKLGSTLSSNLWLLATTVFWLRPVISQTAPPVSSFRSCSVIPIETRKESLSMPTLWTTGRPVIPLSC